MASPTKEIGVLGETPAGLYPNKTNYGRMIRSVVIERVRRELEEMEVNRGKHVAA